MTKTDNIINFVRHLSYPEIPPDVCHQAKRCVIDLIGVGLAGTEMPVATLTRQVAFQQFQEGPCAVFSSDQSLSPAGAALVNSTTASCLDNDDGHRLALGHPGSVIIPSALAIAESVNASGKQLIAAVIAGYEIGTRIGGAHAGKGRQLDTLATGSWGAYAAMTASAKLLGLNEKEISNGLSIAGAFGPQAPLVGSLASGSMVKESIGWSSMTGVSAALLAQKGMSGPPGILENPVVFEQAVLDAGLGHEYQILRTYFKPHASCRWSHAAIDAVIQLTRENHVQPSSIQCIRVRTFREATSLSHLNPTRSEEIQYSIPYTVALAAVNGAVGPRQVTCLPAIDPLVRELATKVEVIIDPEIDALFPQQAGAIIEINLGEKTLRTKVIHPKGDCENPLTDAELEDRFLVYSADVLGTIDARDLLESLKALERINDVRVIGNILRKVRSRQDIKSLNQSRSVD